MKLLFVVYYESRKWGLTLTLCTFLYRDFKGLIWQKLSKKVTSKGGLSLLWPKCVYPVHPFSCSQKVPVKRPCKNGAPGRLGEGEEETQGQGPVMEVVGDTMWDPCCDLHQGQICTRSGQHRDDARVQQTVRRSRRQVWDAESVCGSSWFPGQVFAFSRSSHRRSYICIFCGVLGSVMYLLCWALVVSFNNKLNTYRKVTPEMSKQFRIVPVDSKTRSTPILGTLRRSCVIFGAACCLFSTRFWIMVESPPDAKSTRWSTKCT